ncbi:MAG: hypothetical protein KDK70_27535, partial [Myxococcales bacterium]|nr:hypothetical protein [Myxococcales bacterium]
ADVSMLAHGVQMGEDVDVILTGPGLSPLARTGLWVSPSLGRTRPERRSRATREPFVELHARGCPILSFRASALRYAALGDGVLQPTRVANFQRVVQTLRMACPHASYDARLCGRMEQIRVLGPLLRPEKHLALALALVAGSRPERSPYR